MAKKIFEYISEKINSESILLAVIPLMATILAFIYEAAYLSYYSIPADVIELGVLRIFSATVCLVIVLAFVWSILVRIIAMLTTDYAPTRKLTQFILWALAISFLAWQISTLDWITILFCLSGPLVGLVFYALSSFGRKLGENNEQIAAGVRAGEDIAKRAEAYSIPVLLPLAFCMLIAGITTAIGYNMARLGGGGWVLSGNPEYMFVRKYGETYVFKEFDPKTGKILTRSKFLKVNDGDGLSLKKMPPVHLQSPN